MAFYEIVNGGTGWIIRFKLLDSTKTTPQGLTGLTIASAGLKISVAADVEATTTTYSQAGGTLQTIATLGTYAAPSASNCRFKEYDATNHPGVYEFQFLNTRFSVANARSLMISVNGAPNLIEQDVNVQLVTFDPNSTSNAVGVAASVSGAVGSVTGLTTATIATAVGARALSTAPTANTWDEAMAFAQAGIGKNNVAYTPPSGVNTANGVMVVVANDGTTPLKTFSAVNQDANGNITSRA